MPTQTTFKRCGHIFTVTETRANQSKGVWSTIKRWTPTLKTKKEEEEGLCQACDKERTSTVYEPLLNPHNRLQTLSPARPATGNIQRRAPPPRGASETLLLVEVRGDATAIQLLHKVQILAGRRASPIREATVEDQIQLRRTQDDLDRAVKYYDSVHIFEHHGRTYPAGPLTCPRCRQRQQDPQNPAFRSNRDFLSVQDEIEQATLSASRNTFYTVQSPRLQSPFQPDSSTQEANSQIPQEYESENSSIGIVAPHPQVDVQAWLDQQQNNFQEPPPEVSSPEEPSPEEASSGVHDQPTLLKSFQGLLVFANPPQDQAHEDLEFSAPQDVASPPELEAQESAWEAISRRLSLEQLATDIDETTAIEHLAAPDNEGIVLGGSSWQVEMADQEDLSDDSKEATVALSRMADRTSRFPSFVPNDVKEEQSHEPSHEGELEDFLHTWREEAMSQYQDQEPAQPAQPLLNPYCPEGRLAVQRIREYCCVPANISLKDTLYFRGRYRFQEHFFDRADQLFPRGAKGYWSFSLSNESLFLRGEILDLADSIDWKRLPYASAFSSSVESSADSPDSSGSEGNDINDQNQTSPARPDTPEQGQNNPPLTDQKGNYEAPESAWDEIPTESLYEENNQYASFENAFDQGFENAYNSQDGEAEEKGSPVTAASPAAEELEEEEEQKIIPYTRERYQRVPSPLRNEVLVDEVFF